MKPIKIFPISRLFPNMLTILGLCAGLSAVRYALAGRWELAVALILLAAFIDGLDGRLARLLNATSTFGAQLDSLADVISFGVAPALVMYLWGLHEIRGLGWAMALFFCICCALRLARFNTALIEPKKDAYSSRFFVGVPAPAGAILVLFPIVLSFQFGDVFRSPLFCIYYTPIVALMMASRIPTFSVKRLHVSPEAILPIMLVAGLVIVLFVIETWAALAGVTLLYWLSIPISIQRYRAYAQAQSH